MACLPERRIGRRVHIEAVGGAAVVRGEEDDAVVEHPARVQRPRDVPDRVVQR